MGPFEGAGVSLLGILVFAGIAIALAIFRAGRHAAVVTKPESAPMIDLRKMWIQLSRPPREIREAFGLEGRP